MAYKNGGAGWAPGKEQYAGRFTELNPSGRFSPGQFFGGGEFMAVSGNPNQAGWGDYVPPGYELASWQPGARDPRLGADSLKFGGGTMLLRRTSEPAAAAPAPAAPAPAPVPQVAPQDPTSLSIGSASSPFQSQTDSLLKQMSAMQTSTPSTPEIVEPPKPMVTTSTSVGDNATGFTRKRSSAREAGQTTKGTSRLRISRTGQTSASSGLNIGV
jgi:hypothetical protein